MPRYKHGKIEQTISKETFLKLQERLALVDHHGYPTEFLQALLALLYYSGFRISEIIGGLPHKVKRKDGSITYTKKFPPLFKEQVWTDTEFLYVRQVARKGGHRYAPISIPLQLPYVGSILKYWQATAPGQPIFVIPNVTVWRIWKTVDAKLYSHFFVLNRLTKQAEDPNVSLKDQEDWSGKSPSTIAYYRARAGRETETKKVGRLMLSEQ